jgi:hypothetical protein
MSDASDYKARDGIYSIAARGYEEYDRIKID